MAAAPLLSAPLISSTGTVLALAAASATTAEPRVQHAAVAMPAQDQQVEPVFAGVTA